MVELDEETLNHLLVTRDRPPPGQGAPSEAPLRAARQIMVELTEQSSNRIFEFLQSWEAELQEASDLLQPVP